MKFRKRVLRKHSNTQANHNENRKKNLRRFKEVLHSMAYSELSVGYTKMYRILVVFVVLLSIQTVCPELLENK